MQGFFGNEEEQYSEANMENKTLKLGNFNELWHQKVIFTIRDFLKGFQNYFKYLNAKM
jgi:hypothetical protein